MRLLISKSWKVFDFGRAIHLVSSGRKAMGIGTPDMASRWFSTSAFLDPSLILVGSTRGKTTDLKVSQTCFKKWVLRRENNSNGRLLGLATFATGVPVDVMDHFCWPLGKLGKDRRIKKRHCCGEVPKREGTSYLDRKTPRTAKKLYHCIKFNQPLLIHPPWRRDRPFCCFRVCKSPPPKVTEMLAVTCKSLNRPCRPFIARFRFQRSRSFLNSSKPIG